MQDSMTRNTAQPRAGIIDDIEREDDSKGYEPEGAAWVDVVMVFQPTVVPVLPGWEVAA